MRIRKKDDSNLKHLFELNVVYCQYCDFIPQHSDQKICEKCKNENKIISYPVYLQKSRIKN